MSRLRQQHPQDYGSSGKIHTDFENIVRYLNAAELGNFTVGELLAKLFDENGSFDGPIEMRLNSSTGLEYRIGEYRSAEDGWQLLAAIDTIRGPSGENLGTIDGPFFFNRVDTIVGVGGEDTFTYAFTPGGEDIFVMKNGLLLRGTGVSPDYTYASNTVTLATPAVEDDVMTFITVRAAAVSGYRRLDYVAVGTVATIPFVHTDEERLLVYRNGILQREGGSYDYVKSAVSDTITFITPLANNDVATVVTAENIAQVRVAGLMLEDEYTDGNGFINYAKLVIANNEIPQAKVSGLASALTSKAKITVASSAPSSPTSGDLWLDTSVTPNILKFYQGTQWLAASPDSALPSFTVSNANQYARVNGTGTALEYGTIDFSSLVPKTYMGAANGVASLDASGKMPVGQLPVIYSVGVIENILTSVSNATFRWGGIFKQRIRIDGISAVVSTGTCTIQMAVDGAAIGTTYAVSSTRINNTLGTVIEVDALTAGKTIQIIVTSNSAAANLDVAISYATVTT